MCSCLYFNFIQEHLSFLFPLFTNSLYFSCFTFIYSSTFTLFLFSWDFYFVWTNIPSKYTLHWTRIRNSVSGRKLITIRLLISTSSFCKTVIINFGVEVILAQHDVGAFINYNRLSIKQASREKFLTACLTHWPITGSRGPSVVNI